MFTFAHQELVLSSLFLAVVGRSVESEFDGLRVVFSFGDILGAGIVAADLEDLESTQPELAAVGTVVHLQGVPFTRQKKTSQK